MSEANEAAVTQNEDLRIRGSDRINCHRVASVINRRIANGIRRYWQKQRANGESNDAAGPTHGPAGLELGRDEVVSLGH